MGVWGTCLFGLNISGAQYDLIGDLAGHFPRIALLVDAEADHARLRAARLLRGLSPVFPRLPAGVGDPGELTAAQAAQLCLELLD
jgi:hypothetical protein